MSLKTRLIRTLTFISALFSIIVLGLVLNDTGRREKDDADEEEEMTVE